MANAFRYSMRDEKYPSCTCVCKLWFGKKFLIRKFMALRAGVDTIAKDLDRRVRVPKEGTIYDKAAAYITRARCTKFEVEMVFKSDKAQEILLQEYKMLQDNKANPDCLNTVFDEVEFPKWIPAIDKNAFLAIKDGIQVGQVIVPPRGAGAFRIKAITPKHGESAAAV